MKNMVLHLKQLIKKIHDLISATVENDENNDKAQTVIPKKMTKKRTSKDNRQYRKRNETSSERFRFRESYRIKRYVI